MNTRRTATTDHVALFELGAPVGPRRRRLPRDRDRELGPRPVDDLDHYHRQRSLLIPGYEEVDPDADYYDWSLEWIEPAARLLRPGGHLAVVTGPQQSAAVQLAAQHSGLRFTNSVVVPKINGVAPTSRRYATSHFRLTVTRAPSLAGAPIRCSL